MATSHIKDIDFSQGPGDNTEGRKVINTIIHNEFDDKRACLETRGRAYVRSVINLYGPFGPKWTEQQKERVMEALILNVRRSCCRCANQKSCTYKYLPEVEQKIPL